MTTPQGGLEAAWAGWARALASTLFPGGLGTAQQFAFGQTTLVVDVANLDPQVVNAEVFRIGDAVPAAAPNFVAASSLSEAYSLFLRRIASPDLDIERANMIAANDTSQTAFNMAVRPGNFVPAYQLDSGFLAKYREWQASSVAGRTRDGGVIGFCSTLADAVQPAGGGASPPIASTSVRGMARPMAVLSAVPASASAPPAFLRLLETEPAALPRSWPRSSPGTSMLSAEPGTAAPRPADAVVSAASMLATSGAGNVSIEVAFTGLGTFMLGPTRWFSSAAVVLFESELSPADRAAFFAPSGLLARRVYQVVLGFEPTVTLQFDDRPAFLGAQSLLSARPGASIGIGPLGFGSDAAITGNDPSQTITIGPTASTLPILLGVVSTDVVNFPPAA